MSSIDNDDDYESSEAPKPSNPFSVFDKENIGFLFS